MTVLLVNPPLYDYAALDLWAKPLGLLQLGAALRALGVHVTLLDCLDVLRYGERDAAEGITPSGRQVPGAYFKLKGGGGHCQSGSAAADHSGAARHATRRDAAPTCVAAC